MTKQTVTIEQAAVILIEVAEQMGLEQFLEIAQDVLENNSHEEITLIAQYLPPALRELLPKRVPH